MVEHKGPFFSVVIPTRNRPSLFCEALSSVLQQSFSDKEVIVVCDCIDDEMQEKYRQLESEYPAVTFYFLPHRLRGIGPGYSRNYGAEQAKGQYLCFLDDDDYWCDKSHLEVAHQSLSLEPGTVDIYLTNQDAYLPNGDKLNENIWLSSLTSYLGDTAPNQFGAYRIKSLDPLIKCGGFAHINCSIYCNDFFKQIGGIDENLIYEEDRDLFLRAIDSARAILFNPKVISHHRIPDRSKKHNASTQIDDLQKRLSQLASFEKNLLLAKAPEIHIHCNKRKGFILKNIAVTLHTCGRKKLAASYARQALVVTPTLKWFFYTGYLNIISLFSLTD